MNRKSNTNSETAIVRYLDGTLGEEERLAFNERLAHDSDLRAELRETAEQAVAMGDLGRGRDLAAYATEGGGEMIRPSFPRGGRRWFATAAAAIVVTGAILWMESAGPDPIATLDFADGAVRWDASGNDGNAGTLVQGETLSAGNLSVESASGSAQLTFNDGTRLTVGGESEVSIFENEGKRLELRRGNLTADVVDQPAGQPLHVRTPVAEIEVLGTIFSLTGDDEITSLRVDEGLVRLRRLADGEVVEVPAGHFVTATLDPSVSLAAGPADVLPEEWSLDFKQVNADVTKGERVSVGGVPCFQAEPYVAGIGKDQTRVIWRGVAINSLSQSENCFVRLTDDSQIRLRYRGNSTVTLFLCTTKSGGGFGGNFEHQIRGQDSIPSEDGWREIIVPIQEFTLLERLRKNDKEYDLLQNEISKVLISVGEQRRLQVAEVEIGPSLFE